MYINALKRNEKLVYVAENVFKDIRFGSAELLVLWHSYVLRHFFSFLYLFYKLSSTSNT